MSNSSPQAWRCLVCGYVHDGDSPPDECPICGAPSDDFEPYTEKRVAKAESPVIWQCGVCGHAETGAEPPRECRVCGAPASQFFEKQKKSTPATEQGVELDILIIGNGIAGVSAAEAARETSDRAGIVLVGKEPEIPYYRINLTRYLAGDVEAEQLTLHPSSWYEEKRIEMLHADVDSIDYDNRVAIFADGSSRSFDRLVLATGARPRVPRIEGSDQEGVYTLRTIDDARKILRSLHKGVRCVCIGGGILGLETAGALARQGADVVLLEGFSHLMPRQLPRPGGERLAVFVREHGIDLRTEANTRAIKSVSEALEVELESGDKLAADIVIIATGVQSDISLAEAEGVKTSNGIFVDDLLATSKPGVFAAGDCAEHDGVLYGNWAAAQYQGKIAGINAAGGSVEFGGIPRSHTLKVLSVKMTSIGRFEPRDEEDRVVESDDESGYIRFVFSGNQMVGAVLLGDVSLAAECTKVIESRRDFSGILDADTNVSRVAKALDS